MNAPELRDDNESILTQILSKEHYAELLSSGLDAQNIIDTGCFTVTSKSRCRKLTGYDLTGLVIPYFDLTGQPYTKANGSPFYRIKPDWSSSPNPEECPKYLSPKREGNRPYLAPTYKQWAKALRWNKVPIHLTEGEKTAAALGASGYAAIGLPGVNSFMDRTERGDEVEFDAPFKQEDNEDRERIPDQLEESRIMPELEYLGGADFWRYRKVYLAFDSDVLQKWQVKNALKNLATWLKSKGSEVYIVLIPSEINGNKNGADDFIFRHGVEAYDKAVKAAESAFISRKGKLVFHLPTDPDLPQKASLLWTILKDQWRYRPMVGWYKWQGNHWQLTRDSEGSYIDDDIYRFMEANGWKAQGNGSMANLLRHMRAKLIVDTWDTTSKIAFKNGVLDIETNQFAQGHRRKDFMTVLLPYCYDPSAACPQWLTFLGEALKGDPKAIDLVQAFFRWALLPKTEGKLDIEVGWDLYGVGGTGKGTVLETLINIIGKHNCGHFSSKSISNPNILAGLLDKRVSISPDDNGHMEDFGLYGSIISNEQVLVKMLYKDVFPTTLNTFMVRAYNNIITTPSGAKGLDRRIVAMSFNEQPKVINHDLQAQINAELSGVFNWAWGISNPEMKRRILWAGEVDAVAEATTEMFLANNQTFVFLQEHYPEGAENVKIRDLHYQYVQWSKGREEGSLGERKFSQSIKTFGCVQGDKVNGIFCITIPPFKKIDILRKFGILRGKTKEAQIEVQPETAESRDLRDYQDYQKSDNPGKILEKTVDRESIVEDKIESRDLRDYQKPKPFTNDVSLKVDTTSIEDKPKSNTVKPPVYPNLEVVPKPSPNLKGVITYQRYLMGKIGNVRLNFDKQGLAKEWLKVISAVFGYYGELVKLKEPIGRYSWQIVYAEFDRDALVRLEAKDLSQSPPNR